jgi:hypothetical protein
MSDTSVENVFLTVTIDTECDHDPNWRRSKPLSFYSISEGITHRLQPLFREIGAIPTYLLTVEVMEDDASVRVLQSIEGEHELGTHLHAAFIEPEKKYQDYAGIDSPDFQCNYAPDIEYKKLKNLTDLFIERFGYRPLSFRAGRFGAGTNTIASLEKLNYLIDTSVTPYYLWKEPKGQVDYRGAPEQPYFPTQGNLTCAGAARKGTVLEVPVTVKSRWLRGPLWFRPWFSSIDQMKKVVCHHLKRYQSQKTVVLNMMFHSMEVIPKASPYPQNKLEVTRFLDSLAEVLQWSRQEGIRFCKASDLYLRFMP